MKNLTNTLLLSLFIILASLSQSHAVEFKDLSIINAQVDEKDFSDDLAQKRLDYLDRHKKWGHITMGLMTATVLTGILSRHYMGPDKQRTRQEKTHRSKKFIYHMSLGTLTTASYLTTAYQALRAPKISQWEDSTQKSWHKALAYIHLPAMILSPILGALAFKDYHNGQNPKGIAKLHRPITLLGSLAFLGSYLVIQF